MELNIVTLKLWIACIKEVLIAWLANLDLQKYQMVTQCVFVIPQLKIVLKTKWEYVLNVQLDINRVKIVFFIQFRIGMYFTL